MLELIPGEESEINDEIVEKVKLWYIELLWQLIRNVQI
jgi:hypothetical protein